MSTDRLQGLFDEQGQSPWLDNLKRGYLTSGELAVLRDRGIRGLTSKRFRARDARWYWMTAASAKPVHAPSRP